MLAGIVAATVAAIWLVTLLPVLLVVGLVAALLLIPVLRELRAELELNADATPQDDFQDFLEGTGQLSPGALRAAESDPWSVYQRLTGAGGAIGLRASVNDLVLDQLHALQAHPRISQEDLDRLDLHTTSVRELEVLSSRLSSSREAEMQSLSGRSSDDSVSLDVARLHCDLLALCMSAGIITAATLQIGDRLDRAERGLELGGAHAVSADVDHVVHPPRDPVVAVRIPPTAIAGEVRAREHREVGVDVALVVAPDRARAVADGIYTIRSERQMMVDSGSLLR